MLNPNLYQELNLPEGASLSEIKAAFRRLAKTCHPDSASSGQADVGKFIRAQNAYKKLLQTAVRHNRAGRRAAAGQPERVYRWEGRREEGLEVVYRLTVQRPPLGSAQRLILPVRVQEACPRCFGQGETLAQLGTNGLYRPKPCPRCAGRGHLERSANLAVTIGPEQIGRGKIRLRRAGLYQAASARRGDLILELAWADRLPALD